MNETNPIRNRQVANARKQVFKLAEQISGDLVGWADPNTVEIYGGFNTTALKPSRTESVNYRKL